MSPILNSGWRESAVCKKASSLHKINPRIYNYCSFAGPQMRCLVCGGGNSRHNFPLCLSAQLRFASLSKLSTDHFQPSDIMIKTWVLRSPDKFHISCSKSEHYRSNEKVYETFTFLNTFMRGNLDLVIYILKEKKFVFGLRAPTLFSPHKSHTKVY